MNDRKFLGLLNLYLDGEIDHEAAAALEREILSNPRRREVYGDYCRIHRATKLVYERFRTAATEQGAAGLHALRQNVFSADGLAEADDDPEAASRGPIRIAAYWLGGVAAACAAAYAVFLYAPRSMSPSSEDALAAVSPASSPGRPAAEANLGDVTPIAAPFATEFRLDPFVTQRPFERRSPFSFSTTLISDRLIGFEPAPITTFHLRDQIDRTQMSLHGLSLRPFRGESTNPRVFRHTTDGEPVNFEPVGFQIQR